MMKMTPVAARPSSCVLESAKTIGRKIPKRLLGRARRRLVGGGRGRLGLRSGCLGLGNLGDHDRVGVVDGVGELLGRVQLRGRTDLLVVVRPAQVEELVEDRRERTTRQRAHVVDPGVLPVTGDQLGPERARRVECAARERPRHEDPEDDREADREAGDLLEGPLGVDGRREDDEHEEERRDCLDRHRFPGGDRRVDRWCPEVAGLLDRGREDPLQQQRRKRGRAELHDPVEDCGDRGHAPGDQETQRHRRVEMAARHAGKSRDEDRDHQAERERGGDEVVVEPRRAADEDQRERPDELGDSPAAVLESIHDRGAYSHFRTAGARSNEAASLTP